MIYHPIPYLVFLSYTIRILPFGSIFIEMYFIFTSFWAYKIYYVYGFMLLVFVILTIVTVCVTIVCTYFLLNAEDYRYVGYLALPARSNGTSHALMTH